jgi:hypothetical protein
MIYLIIAFLFMLAGQLFWMFGGLTLITCSVALGFTLIGVLLLYLLTKRNQND